MSDSVTKRKGEGVSDDDIDSHGDSPRKYL